MDCRKSLLLALSITTGCLGCATTQPPKTQTTPEMAPLAPTASTSARDKDGPKRTPRASTEVAFAVFKASEANSPKLTPLQAEASRTEARKAYQHALEIDPSCVDAYSGLGKLYSDMGNHEKAASTCQQGLEKNPRSASLCFQLGMCHCRKKDWPSAIFCLQKACQLDPENRHYANALGVALAGAGRYDESLACMTRTAGAAQAHYNLARALRCLNREDLCKEQLQLALRTDPNLTAAREMLTQMEGSPGQGAEPLVNISFESQDSPLAN